MKIIHFTLFFELVRIKKGMLCKEIVRNILLSYFDNFQKWISSNLYWLYGTLNNNNVSDFSMLNAPWIKRNLSKFYTVASHQNFWWQRKIVTSWYMLYKILHMFLCEKRNFIYFHFYKYFTLKWEDILCSILKWSIVQIYLKIFEYQNVKRNLLMKNPISYIKKEI